MENFTTIVKGAVSDPKQFLATESPLTMRKNAYFTLKARFVLKIFKFLSCFFGHRTALIRKKG